MVTMINPIPYAIVAVIGIIYFGFLFFIYTDKSRDWILFTLQLAAIFLFAYYGGITLLPKDYEENKVEPTEVVEDTVVDDTQYYAVGYKYMDINDLGVNKIIFVTDKGAYEYVNTFTLKIDDYTDCTLLMHDNGTPDNYKDDYVGRLFVNYD